jgi:lipoprotein-releasing system permease protein
MTFESFVSKRYIQSIRKRRRVSVTSRIASVGIGLGVASLVIVLSVMNGFSGLLWERLLALSPHVTVEAKRGSGLAVDEEVVTAIRAIEGVEGATAFLESQGYMFRRIPSGGSTQAGVSVLGIPQEGLSATSRINDSEYRWAGEIDLSVQDSTSRFHQHGVVIGSYLADKMGAVLGSQVRIGFPPSELGTGRTPPMRRYIVTGIFNTGYAEFDTGVALVSLVAAQRDTRMLGLVTGYRARLGDPLRADEVGDVIASVIGDDLRATPWMIRHANLYSSIQLEKWSFYLGLSLIVVIAGFNIVSILSMTVSERRRDIGILKAMGMTEGRIGRVFSQTGVRIGLAGVFFGTVLGVVVCIVQIVFEPLKLPGNVFIVNALPVELRVWDLIVITGAAVALCYLFSLIPARDAAKLRPVDAIRR